MHMEQRKGRKDNCRVCVGLGSHLFLFDKHTKHTSNRSRLIGRSIQRLSLIQRTRCTPLSLSNHAHAIHSSLSSCHACRRPPTSERVTRALHPTRRRRRGLLCSGANGSGAPCVGGNEASELHGGARQSLRSSMQGEVPQFRASSWLYGLALPPLDPGSPSTRHYAAGRPPPTSSSTPCRHRCLLPLRLVVA